MHIVHVGSPYRRETNNGVHRVVSVYAREQRRLGHEVTVLHFAGSQLTDQVDAASGIRQVTLPRSSIPFKLGREVSQFFAQNQLNADLYHFHSAFIARHNLIAQLLTRPYVVSPHGAYQPNGLARNKVAKQAFRRILDRRYLQNAAGIHAITDSELASIRDYAPGSNIQLVPNPIDSLPIITESEREDARLSLGIQPGQRVLLFLGRLDIRHKGIDLLLDGLSRALSNQVDHNLVLIIAGPKIAGHDVEALVTPDLQNHVRILPPVSGVEKRQLFAAADLFVTTSRWDGMNGAVLEALGQGLPALVTEATGLGNLIRDHSAGWVTQPLPESIAGAVISISNGATLASSQEIYDAAQSTFSARTLAQQMVDFYESASARKGIDAT